MGDGGDVRARELHELLEDAAGLTHQPAQGLSMPRVQGWFYERSTPAVNTQETLVLPASQG